MGGIGFFIFSMLVLVGSRIAFQKAEAMAGHDDSGSSGKKSSEATNDIPTFNAENMQKNLKAVYYRFVSTPPHS